MFWKTAVTKINHSPAAFGMAAVIIVACASSASASLLGQNVTVCGEFDPLSLGIMEATTDLSACDPNVGLVVITSAIIVDPGVDFPGLGDAPGNRDLDLTADTLTYTRMTTTTTNTGDLYILTDLIWSNDPGAVITGLTLIGDNPLNIATASDDHSIGLFIPDDTISGTVTFRFETTHSTVSVPEPGTLALFGVGLAGLGFTRRKRAS